ncbi:hypothetical protein EYF80_021975 [Liparis tanakae]|uniref:Uncharacterized protein n=1 Tax=Liparis tanakae TaxID=230148 RepID=A0A4Z2HQG4_9TELE|nr:hypothetical protein EYF80_021975 [Liparis tanakae]
MTTVGRHRVALGPPAGGPGDPGRVVGTVHPHGDVGGSTWHCREGAEESFIVMRSGPSRVHVLMWTRDQLQRHQEEIVPQESRALCLETASQRPLDAVTDTEKLCPQLRLGTLHSSESDMHISERPVSVCMAAV